MNLYLWPLVIFVTAVTVLLGVGWWITRDDQIPLARLADPRPLPGERADLHWCPACGHRHYGRGPLNCRVESYGPFPADTGPLPLLSESAAAWDALEREQRGWSA